MRSLLLALALFLAACGNPDNLVAGIASNARNQPPAYINTVRSAVSGIASVYDAHGNKTAQQISVVALTDHPNLCQQLAAHPDYFRNAPETYVALLLFATPDESGTFYIGGGKSIGAELIAADGPDVDGGTPTAVDGGLVYGTTPFVAAQGQIDITQFDVRSPGQATGRFDVIVVDPNNSGSEFYGQFKTQVCDALGSAILP